MIEDWSIGEQDLYLEEFYKRIGEDHQMEDFNLEEFLDSETYLDSITLHARNEWHKEVFVRAARGWVNVCSFLYLTSR